ncbi:hypothetical protein [Corticicoccus populi]|uniref:ABC transporter permease n=1 Tax=Corticicoccus populi TaxID=1812821 RepID=A0ABW5X2L0_9STAP
MINKIQAVIARDAKECLHNMGLLTTIIMPLLMALLFARTGSAAGPEVSNMMFYIVLGVTFAAMTSSIGISLLADENEHRTMDKFIRKRSDMTANVIGKSILLMLITAVTVFLIIIIFNEIPAMTLEVVSGLILLAFFFLFMTLGFGLISETLAVTSIYIIVMLLVFGMGPYADLFFRAGDNIIITLLTYTPLYQNIRIHTGEFLQPVLVLLMWNAAALIFFMMAFNKKVKTI